MSPRNRVQSVLFLFCLLFPLSVRAQTGPSVLIVTAHPDDEAVFAATVYRITHALHGTVDLALMTDGAGGYRFSVLAEELYGKKLTDPEVAAGYLPAIRKQELMAGGRIVGIRKYFFMDQPDLGKVLDQDSILTYVWDTDRVERRLDRILSEGSYDFVFTHLPVPQTHAHHKAASILALKAVSRMPADHRPVVLAGTWAQNPDDPPPAFTVLENHPETRLNKEVGPFDFDRATKLGLDDRLTYSIVVNWLIAEHKSQGTMQNYIANGGLERYWLYALDAGDAAGKANALFRAVREAPVPR